MSLDCIRLNNMTLSFLKVQDTASIFFSLVHILLFKVLSHYSLSQDIEYSSLCYQLKPCLSILDVIVHSSCF